MDKEVINAIKQEARAYFPFEGGCHGWEHTKRVYKLCMSLGEKEGADLNVLAMAAYLHDIARAEQDKTQGALCHAEKGAEIAEEILGKYGIESEYIENITHCIGTHRYRNNKIPATIEAKVLFDADKIDSIGAVGIGRTFMFAAEVGAKFHDKHIDVENTKPYTEDDTAYREYLVKLQHIAGKMMTDAGKSLAEGRHIFMVEFFDRMNMEVDGEL